MTPAGPTAAELRILVLAPTGRDAALTCSLLTKAGVACQACANIVELLDRVEVEGACALLVAEEVLAAAAFDRVVAMLARQPAWSDIPILLFAGQRTTARAPTAQRLAQLGNVTLLDRPIQPITMISAAKAAVRARRRQYQAREELATRHRQVRERDQFLAMLGHELRNPLGAIALALDMLSRTDPNGSRYRDIIARQSHSLTRLVDDLLDVSRVTTGKIVLQRSRVDVAGVVRRCIQALAPAIAAQHLDVVFAPPAGPLVVDGDLVRIEQIVVNLMGNASKYTPAGGRIDVSGVVDGDQVVVQIRDSGVGIAPDMVGRVFELFSQVDDTLDRAKGGLGIGLTVVRGLVELHGGSVEATSPGLGRGSTFTVRLPRAAGAPELASQPSHHAAAEPGRDVLIVEDNPDSRDMLQSVLESLGHRVDVVGDGVTAVARARERHPEIIVVDIGLPHLDGYGVAAQVRASLGSSVYLVALTGYGQPEDRRRALAAGFDVHMTKPVDVERLQQLIVEHAEPPC